MNNIHNAVGLLKQAMDYLSNCGPDAKDRLTHEEWEAKARAARGAIMSAAAVLKREAGKDLDPRVQGWLNSLAG